jgi:hypothetical protein
MNAAGVKQSSAGLAKSGAYFWLSWVSGLPHSATRHTSLTVTAKGYAARKDSGGWMGSAVIPHPPFLRGGYAEAIQNIPKLNP